MNTTQKHPRVKTLHRRAAGGIASLIAAATLIGLASAKALRLPSETPVVAGTGLVVRVVPAEQHAGYRVRRIFTGRVEARRSSPLGFELAGLVREVLVDEGSAVAAGTPLARLDTARLRARRAELEAALAESTANLALARVTLERMKGVVETGGVSRQGLDEAQEAYRAAQATRLLAQSRIATLNLELVKAELKAPFAGVVTQRLVDEGQVLESGQPVLRLQEKAAPEVRVGVAGWAADALQPGEAYSLTIAGGARRSRLKAVLPTLGASTPTVEPMFRLDHDDPAPRSGDLAELALEKPVAEAGFWLPVSALAEGRRGMWSVYTATPTEDVPANLDATHKLTTRAVEVVYQQGERVYLRATLQQGELVVAAGLHRVVPGQLVRLLRPEAGLDRIAAGGI